MAQSEGLQAFGHRQEGRYTLKLMGQIDLATVDRFRDALQHAAAVPDPIVLIDLSEVDFIDSTGISALIDAEVSARLDAERMQFLAKLHPEVEAVLRMSGIYDELKFYEPARENGTASGPA